MRHSILLEKLVKRPLWLAVAATFVTGCATTQPVAQAPRAAEPMSWVGPAGPAGPAGADGAQGDRSTGAPGIAVAGPAAQRIRPRRHQGPAGATGVSGGMVVGRRRNGPAGRGGARGATGDTGVQGDSIAGPAGPRGPTGPRVQGVAGSAGAEARPQSADWPRAGRLPCARCHGLDRRARKH
jgi:hypothetical protein